MKSIKLRFVAMGLTVAPFILAGWFFASWLNSSAFAAAERATLVVVDPPMKFYVLAERLGFKILTINELDALSLTTTEIRVPKGHRSKSAALLLRAYIPELIVDGATLEY